MGRTFRPRAEVCDDGIERVLWPVLAQDQRSSKSTRPKPGRLPGLSLFAEAAVVGHGEGRVRGELFEVVVARVGVQLLVESSKLSTVQLRNEFLLQARLIRQRRLRDQRRGGGLLLLLLQRPGRATLLW